MAAAVIGAVPANVKTRKVTNQDLWIDTPYFGPGLEADTEHMKAFKVNEKLCGVIREIRETKAEKEQDRRDYLCMEDLQGNKFRLAAPGQLAYLAGKAGLGATVIVTYLGRQTVEGFKQQLHAFDVELVEGALN